MNKSNENIPPLKKSKLNKKAQEKDDEIKRKLQTANQNCNNWIFQIHWNKLEWVNSINCYEKKNPYRMSFKKVPFQI